MNPTDSQTADGRSMMSHPSEKDMSERYLALTGITGFQPGFFR